MDRHTLDLTGCESGNRAERGYLSRGAELATRRDLAEDATWLASLVAASMPDQPEALGLLAMMKLNLARSAARFDAAGRWSCCPTRTGACGTERESLRASQCSIEPAR
jgi:hypothetical protein